MKSIITDSDSPVHPDRALLSLAARDCVAYCEVCGATFDALADKCFACGHYAHVKPGPVPLSLPSPDTMGVPPAWRVRIEQLRRESTIRRALATVEAMRGTTPEHAEDLELAENLESLARTLRSQERTHQRELARDIIHALISRGTW